MEISGRRQTDQVMVGIAHSDYVAELVRSERGLLDFVEVPVERLSHDPSTIAIRNDVPLILHCSSLSIAGTVWPSEATIVEVDKWAKETETPWIGEHLAFVTAGTNDSVTDIGFTVSPVMNEETVDRVVSAVQHWHSRFKRAML